jgi:hypothetical protein
MRPRTSNNPDAWYVLLSHEIADKIDWEEDLAENEIHLA